MGGAARGGKDGIEFHCSCDIHDALQALSDRSTGTLNFSSSSERKRLPVVDVENSRHNMCAPDEWRFSETLKIYLFFVPPPCHPFN